MLAATTVAMLKMGQTAAAAICGIGTVTIVLLIGAARIATADAAAVQHAAVVPRPNHVTSAKREKGKQAGRQMGYRSA